MSDYLYTYDHLRFSKDGSTLVVTSWRDSGFETTFDFPSDLDPEDDIDSELHKRFYLDAKARYEQYLSSS